MDPTTARCADHCVGDKKVDFRRLLTSRKYSVENTDEEITSDGKHIRGRLLGKKKKKKKKKKKGKSGSPWMNGGSDSDDDGPGSYQKFGKYGKSKKKKKDSYNFGGGRP